MRAAAPGRGARRLHDVLVLALRRVAGGHRDGAQPDRAGAAAQHVRLDRAHRAGRRCGHRGGGGRHGVGDAAQARRPGVNARSLTAHGDDSTRSDREVARELFGTFGELPEGDPKRQRVRDQLVEMHLPLVEYLARRFAGRGEPLDDLVQVGTIGLIKAVDRFDTERGVEFSTYATPTVVGEIKRHFRDKGWTVRVPRRLQELRASLSSATSDLTQTMGRSPTVAELAGHLKIGEEEVLEGLESANAYTAVSIEASDGEGGMSVADTLGGDDLSLEGVEYRESIKPLLDSLPPRERRILMLRFFGNLTQSQIAAELGISQMHVSRLLARTLAQLRERLMQDQ